MQSFAIYRRVITQSVRLLADRGYVHGFAGVKNRSQHKSLAERGLIIAGYECMQMRTDVTQLQIRAVLQIFGFAACRSTQLRAENDTASVIKPVTRLDVHRIGAFEGFDIPRVNPRDDFVLRLCEHFTRVHIIIGDR